MMNKELSPLEALQDLLKNPYYIALGRVQGKAQFNNDIQTIETTLKNYESLDKERKLMIEEKIFLSKIAAKQDVILGIIKKKKINLEYLKCCETYEQYKTICSYWNEITRKEFELLKEWLSEK